VTNTTTFDSNDRRDKHDNFRFDGLYHLVGSKISRQGFQDKVSRQGFKTRLQDKTSRQGFQGKVFKTTKLPLARESGKANKTKQTKNQRQSKFLC
jgi:hypothetical protein